MSTQTHNLLRTCASVALTAALVAVATADFYVAENIAFNANGKNPWGPGDALEVGDKFPLLDIPLNPPPPNIHVDIGPYNANPVDIALQALSSALGVPLPDSLVSLKVGGSASGNAHIGFEYFASLGRLNIQYPASTSLNVQTVPGGDYVQSNQPSSIGSTFEPGVTQREIPRFEAIQIGGEGYGEPVYGGLDFTDYNTPEFTTEAPKAMAKLTLMADVRAGLYTEVSAFFGLSRWRKSFNFGGPVGGPLIEINPSGLYVAGEDTGLFDLTDPIDIPLGVGTARVTYPQLGLTGVPNAPNSPVLRGENVSEVFRVDADLEKLIPLIGTFLSGSLAGVKYELLHLTGGPVVSIYQVQTFTPDPQLRLTFSEPVFVDGQYTKVVEGPLGTPINWEPLFSNSSEITITPQYILNNRFRNETGIDVSIEVDLDAISFDAPFLPDPVGPLITPDPFNVSLGRINLLDREWEIEPASITGGTINIPKFNVDQVFNVGDLRLISRELASGTEGTGDATYVLNFNRDVVGGPPMEYQATVAGVGSILITPSGDGTRESGLFEANEDVVLTDLVLNKTYNLGRDFCLYGCDLSLPDPGPAFIVKDPLNPGQFLPPLYVSTLPDIPDTSVDVPNHPILGGPDTSNFNNVVEEEFGTEVIDLRTGPETTILARTREFNPEGDGQFDSFSQDNLPAKLFNNGEAVFIARNAAFFGDGPPRGFYVADGETIETVVRDGDPTPGDDGTISLGEISYRANDVGQIAFGRSEVFRNGPEGLVEIAVQQQAPPDGNGTFGNAFPTAINNLGHVAVLAQVLTPASTVEDAIYVGDGDGLTKIARTGDSAPGLSTPFFSFFESSLNDSGLVAFTAATPFFAEFGIFVGDGNAVTPIAVSSEAPSGGGEYEGFINPQINVQGEVAFLAHIDPPGPGASRTAVYKWEGAGLTEIAVQGQTMSPQGDPLGFLHSSTINDAGDVAFREQEGIYLHTQGALTQIVRAQQVAPDGMAVFAGDGFSDPLLNNQGHVAFVTDIFDGTESLLGLFLYDGTNLIEVTRTEKNLAGSVITELALGDLNDQMQLAYRASLSDGREVIARFEPAVYWRNPGGGGWGTADNWSLRVEPTNPYDVFIIAENALTVTGPDVNRTVKSLSIGGDETASATLDLTSGTTLTATNGTTIRANGVLSGAGTIAGDVSNLGGTVSPGSSPGALQVDGDFNQDSLGLLMLEIGGPLAGSDYDVLDVSGDVLLEGDVILEFLDGYVPPAGSQFNLLRFGGSFDATQATFYVAGAPAGLQYSAFARGGVFGLEIVAVPEPPAMVILFVGMLVMCARRRTRQCRKLMSPRHVP